MISTFFVPPATQDIDFETSRLTVNVRQMTAVEPPVRFSSQNWPIFGVKSVRLSGGYLQRKVDKYSADLWKQRIECFVSTNPTREGCVAKYG